MTGIGEGIGSAFKSIGHAFEDAMERVISREDDWDVPSIPRDERFEAIYARQRAFIDRAAETENPATAASSSTASELSLTPVPGEDEKSESVHKDQLETPFATRKSQRVSGESTRKSSDSAGKPPSATSDEVRRAEEGDAFHSTPERKRVSFEETLDANARNNSGLSGRSDSRASAGSGRGLSIELGAPVREQIRASVLSPSSRLASMRSQALPTPSTSLGPQMNSEAMGTLDEYSAGNAQRIVRRRVVLPYQITLAFGAASIVGVGLGIGILIVSIRNAAWLHGPRAGPQLPEIKSLLLQVVNITSALGNPNPP